jgi:hypothetical protein
VFPPPVVWLVGPSFADPGYGSWGYGDIELRPGPQIERAVVASPDGTDNT